MAELALQVRSGVLNKFVAPPLKMAATSFVSPRGTRSIGKNAVYECMDLTIHAPKSSYAEQYAIKNKIRVVSV